MPIPDSHSSVDPSKDYIAVGPGPFDPKHFAYAVNTQDIQRDHASNMATLQEAIRHRMTRRALLQSPKQMALAIARYHLSTVNIANDVRRIAYEFEYSHGLLTVKGRSVLRHEMEHMVAPLTKAHWENFGVAPSWTLENIMRVEGGCDCGKMPHDRECRLFGARPSDFIPIPGTNES